MGKKETRAAGTGRRRLGLVIASLGILMKRQWSARFGIFAAVFQCIQRWAGHVARMGEERGVYRVLVGEPEGRRPLGRPRPRWVDNIRMDLQEVGCGYVDWIGLAQDRDR